MLGNSRLLTEWSENVWSKPTNNMRLALTIVWSNDAIISECPMHLCETLVGACGHGPFLLCMRLHEGVHTQSNHVIEGACSFSFCFFGRSFARIVAIFTSWSFNGTLDYLRSMKLGSINC